MFQLRDYQQKACDNCLEDLNNHQKIALVLPTGAGKTECFIEISNNFINKNPDQTVLILSHLSILTDQTRERFRLRKPFLRVGVLAEGEKPAKFDRIIIGTMQSASKDYKLKFFDEIVVNDIGLIIIDEAHYLMTESYNKILEYFPKAKVLGCTATPFRKNQLMTNFFDRVSYSMSLQELIDMGFLVPPKLVQMAVNKKDQVDVASRVVSTYKQYENGKSAIVFVKTMKEADELRSVFEAQGVPAGCVTSKITGRKRDEAIEKFNNGTIKVLTTVDVLTAGFDSPRCSVIFQPYGTKSVNTYIQRVGRGLRPHRESGKTHCKIYIFGTSPNIARGFYERVQVAALNANGQLKEFDSFEDDLDYNDFTGHDEKYLYTMNVVSAVNLMKTVGMDVLADALNHKEFPKRFMEKLDLMIERIPKRNLFIPGHKGKITNKQREYLRRYDFNEEILNKLSKGEAHKMIRTIAGPERGPFMVPIGRYAGLHVNELPWNYRKYLKQNCPHSPVAQLLDAWENRVKSA